MYTDENMPILARDYFLSIRNAFDTIKLMKEKAYSSETNGYAEEREEDVKNHLSKTGGMNLPHLKNP